MNTSRQHFQGHLWRRSAGIMLVECLVYIGLFFAVTGIAFSVFYRTSDSSRSVSRTANDIAQALRTGERWRDDLRTASAAPRLESQAGGEELVIPEKAGDELRYRFDTDTISRRVRADGPWVRVMTGLKSSRWEPDQRPHVLAWRWELELKPHRKSPRILPLFTFDAVPGSALAP